MRERTFSGSAVRCALGAVAFMLAGCAGMSQGVVQKGASAEQRQKIVAERAEARWQALINRDLDTAYTFLSPGSKAETSLETYKRRIKPGIWREAKTDRVECEADVCKVTMRITFDTQRMKGIETPLTESWIIENGTPWYVYR
jgi:hypothetical protein